MKPESAILAIRQAMPEPAAWISFNVLTQKEMIYRTPIQSLQKGVYQHSKLFSEEQMQAILDHITSQAERVAGLTAALKASREKLALYRGQHSGEYIGGMEFSHLLQIIDAAIEQQGTPS